MVREFSPSSIKKVMTKQLKMTCKRVKDNVQRKPTAARPVQEGLTQESKIEEKKS